MAEAFFDQIRQQIHEIRNLIGPVNLKLAEMEHQITTSKAFLEEKTLILESKLMAVLFRLDNQEAKIAHIQTENEKLSERMEKFEHEKPKK